MLAWDALAQTKVWYLLAAICDLCAPSRMASVRVTWSAHLEPERLRAVVMKGYWRVKRVNKWGEQCAGGVRGRHAIP